MSSSQVFTASNLYSKDQELLTKLEAFNPAGEKAEKAVQMMELVTLDRTQTILKCLAKAASEQFAFGFMLWLMEGSSVSLDWIYDTTYKISTEQVNIPSVNLETIYFNSSGLERHELNALLQHTDTLIQTMRLDDVDPRNFAKAIEPELAMNLITWLVIFRKVTLVDLNNIAEIARKFKANTSDSAPESSESATPSPAPSSAKPIDEREKSLEDLLLALNLRQGGSEELILCRTLDILLFMRATDPVTGTDQIIFKPGMKAIQYFCDAHKRLLRVMPVASTQTWSPGVYQLKKGNQEVRLMRLPGSDYFEIFPEDHDPYMRALTIQSTLA